MDRGVQNSTFFTIDNFEDLDVPGGIEGEFLKAQFLKIKKKTCYMMIHDVQSWIVDSSQDYLPPPPKKKKIW